MLSRPHRKFLKYGTASTALAVSLLAASLCYAQEPSATASPPAGGSSQAGGAEQRASGENGVSNFVGSLIPGLQFGARVDASESYITNALGTAGSSQKDYLSTFNLGLDMHEHSRRVSLDANYSGSVYYYAQGSQTTQFSNDLQAVGNVMVIPEYLNFFGKAFAQPVVVSNVGVVTANGNITPNGFRNSYGFSAGPDLTFRLGDFATSDTNATYGAAYFGDTGGGSTLPLIPGIPGPQNMTSRGATERLTSGTDFNRLTWSLVASLNEMARPQGLLAEKAGIANFRYHVTPEVALLATGGYDAVSNTIHLTQNISGPVALGGLALTFGEDFSLEIEAGQKYNNPSVIGSLRYNLSPTTSIIGSATDYVSTPEGQLLNSLTDLTATPGGSLTSSADLYGNGTASSLASFNAQTVGNSTFDQTIARYQSVTVSFSKDFERDHFRVGFSGSRRTDLSGFFLGPPTTNSWTTDGTYSYDITRLLKGSVGLTYGSYQQLGGDAQTYAVQGQLAYSLSEQTNVYFRTDYITRDSSSSLQALSPFTGSTDDLRITLGLSHTL